MQLKIEAVLQRNNPLWIPSKRITMEMKGLCIGAIENPERRKRKH
jgi:hypothetical protein